MQLQRAMRILWAVAVLGATRAMADPVPAAPMPASPAADAWPHLGFTLRMGLHHTRVRNAVPNSSGYGPTIELEPTLHSNPYLSLGVFLGWSRYGSALFHDEASDVDRDADFSSWTIGARLYLQPHPRAFLGVAIYQQWETADLSALEARTVSYSDMTAQLIAGVNLVRIDRMVLQLAGTYASYDRSGGGDATIVGVSLGVHGE